MMSGSLGANTGTSTPNLGVAGQGGELFKGFSAFVGNKVTSNLTPYRWSLGLGPP